MEAEVDTIRNMCETLESSGCTRDQSDALIESVALAMKTFAVTPEVLDDRLADQKRDFKEMFSEHKRQTNQRFDGIDKRLDKIPKLRDPIDDLKGSTHELQRSLLRYFLAFTLVVLAGLMGTLGAVLGS